MRIINVTPKMDALLLGKQGENKSTKFLFDVSGWLEDYPGCTITLVHRRPHESSSYPCVLTTEEDGRRSWVINSADLAKDGDGQAELKCTLGDVIEKDKRTWKTKIGKSLSGDGDAPEQWESLMDDIEALVGDAQDAAEDAETAKEAAEEAAGVAAHAPIIQNGYWYVWDATTEQYVNSGVKAQGQDTTPALITADYSELTFPVAAGTMCSHNGLLYKANQTIATSEAWTAAHWTQTTIEAEQSTLKTKIMLTGAYYIDRNLFENPASVNSNASNVINAAIIDAQTKGLQYCVIPEGEYWITQTIYLKSDVILCGCGIDATTLKIADGCDIDAIRVTEPVNNSGLMDLAIDGNRIENYSVYVNGHHGNAINVWLHYGRIERVRTDWVFKHSLLLNYDTGNSDDGLGFEPEHQNDMGNLNKVLWCDFRDSLLQGVMWGWRTMDSWMCYTNIGSHAANLYLEGGTSRFIGNHFDGDGDNGAGPEYNVYCGDGCRAMVFEDNIFENTQKENIFFRQPSYSNQTMTITIANNIIRTCSKSQNEQYANIKISGYSSSVPATEIIISGNQILNPDTNANHGYAGIHLLYCENSKITGNTFFNVGDDEVLLDNTCENVLDDSKMSEEVSSLLTEINSKVDASLMQSCKIAKIGASANLWNKDDVSTGLYYKNGNIYTGGSYDNYRYNNKKISVEEGDVLSFYVVNQGTVETRIVEHIACFTANGTVDANKGISNTQVVTFTIPSGIASVIINANISWPNFMVLKNAESAPTEYIPYSEGQNRYVAKDEFIPEDVREGLVGNKVDKDGTKQIKGKNCEFVSISPNLYDPSAVVVGLVNKVTGVVLDEYTNYRTSDWIEVEGSAYYTFSSSTDTYIYWVWYNASKGWISGGEKTLLNEPTKQAPATAKYIRFSIITVNVNKNVQFEKGNTATDYRGYGTGYIVPDYMPPEEVGITFNIPKKVYALVGYETNIYFENLVEDWTKYKWDVSCTKGMQLERGYRITPQSTDVGTYTLTFHLSVGNHVEQFSTTLVVVSASAGSGVSESLIILGDSTTANSIAVTKLNANLDSDVYSLSTIGTKGTSPNNHEGRSGWRFSTYFSNDADNAFYNPTSQTFDASYYFTNSGVSKPDWFFINLGINDVFGSTNDSDLDTAIDGCVTYCDSMIESILEASPSTKIGICLTIPPNHSQDAFGKEYKCGQNRNRYKRNNLLWVHSLIEEYDDREDEGIYLIPIHAVLDTVYNMGFETIPINARNTAITYESPIGNGGVHPVESGYWQIADQYTAFLKGNASA